MKYGLLLTALFIAAAGNVKADSFIALLDLKYGFIVYSPLIKYYGSYVGYVDTL